MPDFKQFHPSAKTPGWANRGLLKILGVKTPTPGSDRTLAFGKNAVSTPELLIYLT